MSEPALPGRAPFSGGPLFLYPGDPMTPTLFADIIADSAAAFGAEAAVAVVIGTASFLAGRYWGRLKAHRDWSRQEFFDRILVTLNIFADDTLKIRTITERSLAEVFPSPIAVEKILAAAKRCTVDTPVLPLAPNDRWYLLNYVLNAVAEQFADGHVRQDAGVPVTTVRYALYLTCEVVGDDRIRKVRAMLVRREHLAAFPYPDSLPKLENHWHDTRVKTLRTAAALAAVAPDNFVDIDVCV